MVSEIPTFRSNRVTQIPSMGIVEQTGLRSMANSMSNRAKLADQVGEFANKKANEYVERKMTIEAQNMVRTSGLDPATLSDPITMADKIYRESAINTYNIQVEDSLNKTIQQNATKYENNPTAFLNESQAYVKGVVNKLPPEMQNSFEANASASITKNHYNLSEQLRARVKAEAIAVEDAFIEQQISKIINTDDKGERQVLMASAVEKISNSARFITPGAKDAKIKEINEKIVIGATLTDLTNKDTTPLDAIEAMKSAGVAVDSSMTQRVFSAYTVRDNYEAQQANNAKAMREAKVDAIESAAYTTSLNLNGAIQTEEQFRQGVDATVASLVAAGANGKEIDQVRTTMSNIYYGNITDNSEVVLEIDRQIADVNPMADSFIKLAMRNGTITPATAQDKLEKIADARGGIQTNSQVKQWEATYLRSNPSFALAYLDPVQLESLQATDPETFRRAKEQQLKLRQLRDSVNSMVNNPDPAKRTTVQTALSTAQGNLSQTGIDDVNFLDLDLSNPEVLEIKKFISADEIIVKIPFKDRNMANYMDSNDIKTDNLSEFDAGQIQNIVRDMPQGKLTRDNARNFLKGIEKINKRSLVLRPKDPVPYSEDFIEGIRKYYGLD